MPVYICLCILIHRLSLYVVTCLLLCILKMFSQLGSYHLTSPRYLLSCLSLRFYEVHYINIFRSSPIDNKSSTLEIMQIISTHWSELVRTASPKPQRDQAQAQA